MAQIIRTYREELPQCCLIGKRYTEADAHPEVQFGPLWGQWFAQGWFAELEKLPSALEDAYIAAMRQTDTGSEYWIGMFFPSDTKPPQGFSRLPLGPAPMGTAWIQGSEEGRDLYAAKGDAFKALQDAGLTPAGTWCFERYACPRFTTPDENGNVILDFCALLAE